MFQALNHLSQKQNEGERQNRGSDRLSSRARDVLSSHDFTAQEAVPSHRPTTVSFFFLSFATRPRCSGDLEVTPGHYHGTLWLETAPMLPAFSTGPALDSEHPLKGSGAAAVPAPHGSRGLHVGPGRPRTNPSRGRHRPGPHAAAAQPPGGVVSRFTKQRISHLLGVLF